MPGYAVKFMTSANISVDITRRVRRLDDLDERRLGARGIISAIMPRLDALFRSFNVNAINETDRNPRCKSRWNDFN